MAKASVTFHCTQCGAEYTREKTFQNRRDANSWESFMRGKDGLCLECWKKEQHEKQEKEKEELAITIQQSMAKYGIELPDLTGSEKQIKWAEYIRNCTIQNLTAAGCKWEIIAAKSYPESAAEEVQKLFEPSAKVWIESRGKMIFGMAYIGE